jgi:hypothetical protein
VIELILGILGVAVAVIIVYLVRRDHLHVDHGMSWIIAAIGFAGLGFAPGIIDWIAEHLGVGYPPILGVSLAIIVLALKTLLMDMDRAKLQTQNLRLTQRLAMLEGELGKRDRQRQGSQPDAGAKPTESAAPNTAAE